MLVLYQQFILYIILARNKPTVEEAGDDNDDDDVGLHDDDKHVPALVAMSPNFDTLLARLQLSNAEIAEIEQKTRGQSRNPLWKKLRRGRITPSNFYRVYTKVESIKRKSDVNCSKLVESLITEKDLGFLPQISHGVANEPVALIKITQLLQANHKNLRIRQCGLFIDSDRPYLGASPDGLVECDCCHPMLIEIKCPTLAMEALKYLDCNKQLKPQSAYYAQVQGQMSISKTKSSYFFIYYGPEQYSLSIVDVNKKFITALFKNLEYFFKTHIVPALTVTTVPPIKKRKCY